MNYIQCNMDAVVSKINYLSIKYQYLLYYQILISLILYSNIIHFSFHNNIDIIKTTNRFKPIRRKNYGY
jgi:hypothetical protein